jgi:hypothetical protein
MPVSQSVRWRKSSYSGSGESCIEVGQAPGVRAVRDSKLGEASPVLRFGDRAFTEFLHHLLG